jgi:CheY-like chemotaxis protein
MYKLKKILVVEDEDDIRETIRAFLESENYSVVDVNSGNSAMEVLSKEADSIDLIMTDVAMPDGDGAELIKYLVDNNLTNKVVVVTSYGNMLDPDLLERANGSVLKPFRKEYLLTVVKEILEL